jgi:hypothetical protein
MGKMKEIAIEIENNKKDIFDFLDGYYFVSLEEVELAAGEYIENTTGSLYRSDLVEAAAIAKEYIEKRSLHFNE